MSTHHYAFCRCGWHVENPSDYAQEQHRKQPGHVTISRQHPRQFCTAECHRKETR